jgi:hypothetical protein
MTPATLKRLEKLNIETNMEKRDQQNNEAINTS